MDGNRKRSNPQFIKSGGGGGGGNKRGRFGEQSLSSSPGTSETVYRILCPSRKIASLLGKGGEIIKALREDTQAKITVAESVPGSEERVVMVYSPSAKLPATESDLELHCAAQDALLRVHDKIVAQDLLGGTHNADGSEIAVVTRLLVPNNTLGCIIGKKGDVITRLRSQTGATIRVMPTDQLPACAMTTDDLVQISAAPAVAKRALHVISTLLHQNPRKDKAPAVGGQGMLPPGPASHNFPPTNLMRPGRGWMSEYATEPPRFGHDGFNGFNSGPPSVTPGQDPPMDFSMKILCSSAKIGPVIGTAGSNVRQLQQETGTNIHVGDASVESDERVICVSSFEPLSNPRSRTIDAILLLQDKTSDYNEKGIVTTRILIPSSKVGCIIGQGGQVINEMRRRTKADIRVNSKEEKPKCAAEDEELVQVSGSYGVAKEVLGEIASRFRARCLRDGNPGADSGPGPGFVPRGNFSSGGPPPFGTVQGGHPGGYGPSKGGGRDYGPNSYPVPPTNYDPRSFPPPPRDYKPYGYPAPPPASGYPGAVDVNMPNSGRVSGMGPGSHNVSEVPGTRLKPQDPYATGAEPVSEMPGSNATHGVDVYQGYAGPGGQNHTLQPAYHNYGTQQGLTKTVDESLSEMNKQAKNKKRQEKIEKKKEKQDKDSNQKKSDEKEPKVNKKRKLEEVKSEKPEKKKSNKKKMKCTGKTKKTGKMEKVNMEESAEEESEEEEHEDEIGIEAKKENEEKQVEKRAKCLSPLESEPKPKEKEEKIEKRPSRFLVSPYLNKKTAIKGKATIDEEMMTEYLFSMEGEEFDFVFETKDGAATIRDYMQTLAPQLKVESNVIDTFSLVLNHEQKMNSKGKKTKYFFHTTMITKDMFNWKKANGKYDEEKQFEAFSNTIHSEFKNDPEMENMKDLEMAFFPIIAHEHYYLVVFNFLKGNTVIIDNSNTRMTYEAKYKTVCELLKKLFSMHLERLKHPRAKDVLNKNPTIIRPKWGTKENDTDCGIFLMMHMEHYDGETTKSWNLEFPTEKEGNTPDIIKMRLRLATKILSHEINIHREKMSTEAQEFARRNNDKNLRKKMIKEAIKKKKEKQESERIQSAI